jgi:predicted nuclease of predicted toxin-antitoxin system
MRVLLDECLPRRLKALLVGHDVVTVPEAGWAGKQNGELLRLASADFDVFVTLDQNLEFQQNLGLAGLAVVILESGSSRFEDLLPLRPRLLEILGGTIKVGEVIRVGA